MKAWSFVAVALFSICLTVHARAQSDNSSDNVALLQQSVNDACVKNTSPGMMSRGWFGTDFRYRILSIAQAAKLRKDALSERINPIEREEERFKTQLARENDLPPSPTSAGDVKCLTNYLALLAAIDAPSRELMEQETAQALAANNASQLSQTAQQIQVQQEQAQQETAQKVAADQLAAQQHAMQIQAANDALAAQQRNIQAGIAAAHSLPGCDTDQTLNTLKGAMFLGGYTVQSFDHSTDASSQPFGGTGAEPERFCKAHFVTNTQDGQIVFGIKWTDDTHKGIDIQFMNNP
jgi:hypothetical protein